MATEQLLRHDARCRGEIEMAVVISATMHDEINIFRPGAAKCFCCLTRHINKWLVSLAWAHQIVISMFVMLDSRRSGIISMYSPA